MKKIITALLLSAFIGCEVVPSSDYTQPYEPENGSSNRVILLEEYTGLRCVNCPAAAEKARLLEKTYGDRLITVSIHAGEFAWPAGIFTRDLRTEAGSSYFNHFGFAGTPMGCVNRSPYRSAIGLSPPLWGAAIDEQLKAADEIEMELAIDFNHSKREFIVRCDVRRLDKASQGELSLNLWLVEDSITTAQVIPSGVDMNYIQRHVMRGALNGTWGESLDFADSSSCLVERSYALPQGFDADHCSVVAFVSERESLRVSQAAKGYL